MNVLNLACEPLETVRVGFIGLGDRGYATLQRYMALEGVEVTALCDLSEEHLQRAAQVLSAHNRPQTRLYREADGWQRLCHDSDTDLVIVATPWRTHTHIAVEAMQSGKHVALEVPAAMTVANCWTLVDTAERTRRHCVMLENCCYDPFHLVTMQLAREGLLGDITHCEGAYIHDLRDEFHKHWMLSSTQPHRGNPYPTHGLGPICQLLGIHRTDRLTHLVSLSSEVETADNHVNNTLLHTALGRTILIQYDITTPRPYSRLQVVCGTRGFAQKYPQRTLSIDNQPPVTDEAEIDRLMVAHMPSDYRPLLRRGEQLGVPNMMNYLMDVRLTQSLLHGRPLDIDVYDAAEWSSLTELTHLSALQGGAKVEVPDFTRGAQ